MFKKLTTWFFLTLVAGALPFGFKLVTCSISHVPITYSSNCSEVFFFNLMLSVNSLKELYDNVDKKKLGMILYFLSIFILLMMAVIYGFLLLNENLQLNLELSGIYASSIWFTLFCILTNLGIQILGGTNKDDE